MMFRIIGERMMNIEMKVSVLYRIFSDLFPEDGDFWREMSDEEIEHKHFIQNNLNESEVLRIEEIDMLESELAETEEFLDKVIKKYSVGEHNKLEAYEDAFKIESSALERHVSRQKSDDEVTTEECFAGLQTRDVDHLSKIMKIMKKAYIESGSNYNTLLKIGLKHEMAARSIYLFFASHFAFRKEAFSFFWKMAEQESDHYNEILKIYDRADKKQLKEEYAALNIALDSFVMLIDVLYNQVKDVKGIEDAVRIAHLVENSEINAIFKGIIDKFMDNDEKKNFILKQLKEHNSSLISFAEYFK